MSDSELIDDLMLRWEAARQQGNEPAVEELCAQCPQLASELGRRIRAVLAMEQVMGVSEHDPNRITLVPPAGDSEHSRDDLPSVPGYEIIRVIGQGGMGVVYQARQIELGRSVAIKMIWGPRLRAALVARFRVEAEAAARLQHPNFVQIFEVGQVNGRPFFSMEYVAGGNLADLLARQPPSARQAAELVETLARAIHAAHEKGVLHRDLKPANILLALASEQWSAAGKDQPPLATDHWSLTTPKIADFGLAKRLDEDAAHTHTGEILGTPSYMAPEQAEGNKNQIGPATDVYALGAILYELLTGKPPFQGASPLDSLRRVLAHEPIAPSRRAPTVPRDLDAICLKCLEKAPGQRYPSALALAEDVRRFLNGQPVLARRIGPIQRSWKWARRHPQAVALGVALATLMLVPMYFLLGHFRAQRELRLKALEQAPLAREILQRNCFECHGGDPRKTQKNLNILNHRQLLDVKRRIVVPGAPENSRLIQRIADGSMPPEKEEIRLPRVSEQELAILNDWILGGAPPFPAADPVNPVASAAPYSELAAKTKRIFLQHCYECHKSDVAEGGIKIMHHRLLISLRKVVIPGQPEDSELYQHITSTDDEFRMPPVPNQRLAPEEIAVIRDWILEGAPPFPKGE